MTQSVKKESDERKLMVKQRASERATADATDVNDDDDE